MSEYAKTSRRNKGAGSIVKRNKLFYLRVRCKGKEKTVLLTDVHGIPVTNRAAASSAAAKLTNIIESNTIDELSVFIKAAKLQLSPPIPVENACDHYINSHPPAEPVDICAA